MPVQKDMPPLVRLLGHPLRWRLVVELSRSDRRVRELVAAVDQPQNLVSYHLRLLRAGGLLAARRSSFDGRDTYYTLDLGRCARALTDTAAALHPALRLDAAPPQTPPSTRRPSARRTSGGGVLFLCTGNSARSPMAEALLRHRTSGRVEVESAGSHPKPRLHPTAVRVMREDYGIDLTNQRPQHLDAVTGRRFDYVISLCDKVRETCPEFEEQGVLVHWSIPDPATVDAGQAGYSAFRDTATELDRRIGFLLPVLEHAMSDREK
jgi:ArsR family transcriptional regulator, arsenate/arsenite/antimonite-responsive transcriptional repressor / arsenate reductase (thioredoxin)